MKNLFEMLQAIFGKNIISKTIGTRTNVIKLPTNKSSPLKNEFDVFKSAENPAVFEKLKKVIEDEAPYISRMNDAERLIYEGNVKRLHDYLVSIGEIKPAITAEVVGLTTKEPISGKGLESLVEEAGQTSPPGTLIGDIQSRINRLKTLAKEEGTTMQDVVGDFASGQKGMLKLQDEGLVRATARQIMFNDIKSGKLKAPKEVQDIVSGTASGDPLDSFRTIYGENALEQLDSLTPDLRQLRTEVDAEKLARSKFEFTPKLDRPKESYTPEEMKKILETEPEEFAKGGSVGLDYLTGQDSKVERENYGLGSGLKVVTKEPAAGFYTYTPSGDGSGLRAIIRAVPQPSAPPITLDAKPAVVRPEDDVVNRYREYFNVSKPVQSDLEKRYRELVNPPKQELMVEPMTKPLLRPDGTIDAQLFPIQRGLSFTSPQGEKIGFTGLMGFVRPNGEPYTGPVPENIRNATRFLAANGGRIGYAEGSDSKDDIVNRYREYLNTSKPSQSDLENKYRELINPIGKEGTKPGFTSQPIPSLIQDYLNSSFSKRPTMGHMALVPITLPTGETYTLSSGGEASNFRDFLGSLNMTPENINNIFERRSETPPHLAIPTPTPPIVEKPIPILERPTPVPSPTMPTPNLTTPIVETPTPNLTAPIVETPTSTIPTPFPSIPTPVPIMEDNDYANLNPAKQIPYKDNPIYENFLQSPFYDPRAIGGAAMTEVRLPTGEFFSLPNTAVANQFRQYLSSTPAGGAPVQGNLQSFSLSNIYKNSQEAPVGIESSQSFSLPNIYKNGERVGFKIGGSVGLGYLVGE